MSVYPKQEPMNRNSIASEDRTSMLSSLQCASEDCVKEYPVSSTMLALGAGAALGLMIASSLGRREDAKRSKYVSQLGNQIASSIGNAVPDSLNWRR